MRFLLVLLVLPLLFTDAFSQTKLKKIESYLEKARSDWGVPGMAVAIVKDGKVVLNKGFGVKEAGQQEPVDENTLFAIASNTKAFISSALGNLVADGSIDWDDKVVDYLPYFELYDAYVTREITIRDLLCHRAGLGTYSGDVIWYKSELTAEEVIRRSKYVPQAFSFRSGYGYSNLMFIVAGEVIKAVTGMEWDDYLGDSFFDPLNMTRTITTSDDLNRLGNFATPHKPDGNKNLPIDWVFWEDMGSGAAAGIITSSSDMAKWINMNLQNGIVNGDTILDPKQQNILWTPHNNFVMTASSKEWIPGRHFNGYGLGWGTYDYHGRQVITHGGGYDGMYSRVVLVPDENLGFVMLTNSMIGISNPLMLYLINAYIGGDEQDWSLKYLNRNRGGGIEAMVELREAKRKENTKPSKELEEYTGNYHDPMYGTISTTLADGKLRLNFENAPALSATLEHWHYDTWEIKWDKTHAWFDFGTLRFDMDNNLEILGIEFDVPNYDIFFDEIHAKIVK